jgi:hypothetical protein
VPARGCAPAQLANRVIGVTLVGSWGHLQARRGHGCPATIRDPDQGIARKEAQLDHERSDQAESDNVKVAPHRRLSITSVIIYTELPMSPS